MTEEPQIPDSLPTGECAGAQSVPNTQGTPSVASSPVAVEMPRILLHACCGPCTLEPSRILAEQGLAPTVYYANSNIEPAEEYERRLITLKKWAADTGLPIVEGPYDNASWRAAVADCTWENRVERCRACYRHRFEETASYAVRHGFETIGTTLSVSPYQHTEIIAEELQRAARIAGVKALFQDYRPQYPQATQRSRDLGMYRQNYCGCALSDAEATRERAERKAARATERAIREQSRAAERAAKKEALLASRAEKARYAEERARRRQILKQLRTSTSANSACPPDSTEESSS